MFWNFLGAHCWKWVSLDEFWYLDQTESIWRSGTSFETENIGMYVDLLECDFTAVISMYTIFNELR